MNIGVKMCAEVFHFSYIIHLFVKNIFFKNMHMCFSVCLYTLMQKFTLKSENSTGSPEAGVTGFCVSYYMGARN